MIKVNGKTVLTETFPNQETKVKEVIEVAKNQDSLVELIYESDADLVQLLFVKSRLDECQQKTKLFIWYMPYSRMDRQIPGDLFTLKYVCQFIGGLGFESVLVLEPHSKKTEELLETNGVKVKSIYPVKQWAHQIMEKEKFSAIDHIVYPDKGARSRYEAGIFPNLLTFEKKRDAQTGVIQGLFLKEGHLNPGSHCIIMDDLCARGGTFMSVGKILKEGGAKRVSLLVAHCENTVFEGPLLKDDSPIDRIYTSPSMLTKSHEKITLLPLEVNDYES